MTRFDARTHQPKSTVAYGSLRFGLMRHQLKRTNGMLPKPDNSECSRHLTDHRVIKIDSANGNAGFAAPRPPVPAKNRSGRIFSPKMLDFIPVSSTAQPVSALCQPAHRRKPPFFPRNHPPCTTLCTLCARFVRGFWQFQRGYSRFRPKPRKNAPHVSARAHVGAFSGASPKKSPFSLSLSI